MQYESTAKVGKKGWSEQETNELLKEAQTAERKGLPLKAVFERVARITGRKPNSIRNYYYTKIKEINPDIEMAFTPFAPEEVQELLRAMLVGQAQGKSVRKIAFELGKGDKKRMLRYQNKYRSVLKNEPMVMEEMIAALEKEGLVKKGQLDLEKRPYKKRDTDEIIAAFMETILGLGKEGQNMLVAMNSAFGKQKNEEQIAPAQSESSYLQLQYDALKEQYIQLENVNATFLALSAMERIATLPEYIASLKNCIG